LVIFSDKGRGVMEEIFVPALGVSAENVYLQKWLKAPGDSVQAGEAIAIIETDKAELEITSNTSGIMGKQLFNEDTDVAVGVTICVLLHESETEN
jgi:pyruvate/2-oxoglutarate dehydrogenase complex dihydrolipoamide acyltransferase (E2) component